MAFDFEVTVGQQYQLTGDNVVQLVKRRATPFAPEGVLFEINFDNIVGLDMSGPGGVDAPAGSTVTDPRYHLCHVVWDFGDANAAQFDHVRIQGGYKDSNTAIGPVASHVYRQGGSYDVTALVYDPKGDKLGLFTYTFVTGNENDQFTDAQTIIVDPLLTGIGEFPGATVLATVDAATAELRGRAANEPTRLIIPRGQTYAASDLRLARNADGGRTTLVRTYGTGARPILDCSSEGFSWSVGSSSGTDGQTMDMIVQGMEMRGQYSPIWTTSGPNADPSLNPDTSTSNGGTRHAVSAISANPAWQVLVDDLMVRDFEGHLRPSMQEGSDANPPNDRVNWFGNDLDMVAHWEYAMIGGVSVWAMTGVKSHQDSETWTINPPHDTYATRIARNAYQIWSQSDYYTKMTQHRSNPALRMDTVGWGPKAWMWASIVEGGTQNFSTGTQGGNPINARAGQFGFRQSAFVGSYHTNGIGAFAKGSMSLMSCLLIEPDVNNEVFRGGNSRTFDSWIDINSSDTEPSEFSEGIWRCGNTCYSHKAGGSAPANFGTNGSFPNVFDANNAFFVPGNDVSDGPFDISVTLGAPAELGAFETRGSTVATAGTASPAGTIALPRPQVGAGAIQAASGTKADGSRPHLTFDGADFDGTFIGALSPA